MPFTVIAYVAICTLIVLGALVLGPPGATVLGVGLVALALAALVRGSRIAWLLLLANHAAGLVLSAGHRSAILIWSVSAVMAALLLAPATLRHVRVRGRGDAARPA